PGPGLAYHGGPRPWCHALPSTIAAPRRPRGPGCPARACAWPGGGLPPMNKQSTRRLALLLGGLAMFGPFSIDTIFPAFPQMAAQLGADKVAMQQTISVYLAAYALMSVVHGPLSDAIGRRRVILGGLVVFTLA